MKEKLKATWLYDCYDSLRCKMRELYYRLLPRKSVISKKYRQIFGHDMNWTTPRDLNEKSIG